MEPDAGEPQRGKSQPGKSQPGDAQAGRGQLGAKIDRLIEARYPDRRARPGFGRLAAQIRDVTGDPISGTYLWELASGRKRNITQHTLATLAAFFAVPAEYFLDEATAGRIEPQLELAAALRNPKVRSLALRADGLSDDTLDALLAMAAEARRIERLGPPPQERDAPPEP